jgi:hypothetical protein
MNGNPKHKERKDMAISKIVFSKDAEKEIEVGGHKIVIRKLTTRDTLGLEVDMSALGDEKADLKTMLASTIDILSSTIVSVDGEKADGKEDAKEFLMNLEQRFVTEIFTKSQIGGEVTEQELKN